MVGDCSSSGEALRILKSREVDMILLDLDLGTERGSDLLEKIRAESFTGKVLFVTAGVNQNEVPNLIRKGISGIFMKHGSPALLVKGIREAMEGRAIFEQDMLRRSLEIDEQSEARQGTDRLSERERQVLSFILEGLGNKQIADRLQISESAVESQFAATLREDWCEGTAKPVGAHCSGAIPESVVALGLSSVTPCRTCKVKSV